MREEGKEGKAGNIATLVLGAACALYALQDMCELFYKHQPNTSKVQSEYVVPSKLEIKVKDIDGNGERETLIEYNGRTYLFKLDEAGKPIVQPYEVKPVEAIPSK